MKINSINNYSTNFKGTLRINVGSKKNPKYYDIETSQIAGIGRGHNTNTKNLAFIKLKEYDKSVVKEFTGMFCHNMIYNANFDEVVCTDRKYGEVIAAYTAAKGKNVTIEA